MRLDPGENHWGRFGFMPDGRAIGLLGYVVLAVVSFGFCILGGLQ